LATAAFNKRSLMSKLNKNLRKKLIVCCIWSTAVCGAETWILRKVDQKYLESSEMLCWGSMVISWTERVRHEEVLHRVKGERNIVKYRKYSKKKEG
jgi:hypothetical protein